MKHETIGEMIRRLRTERGITSTEAAKLAGISQPYLSQIEHGKFIPSPTVLERLAEALNVAHSMLLVKAGHVSYSTKQDADEASDRLRFTKDLDAFVPLVKTYISFNREKLEIGGDPNEWITEVEDPFGLLNKKDNIFMWPSNSPFKDLYNGNLKSEVDSSYVYKEIRERSGYKGLIEERRNISKSVSFLLTVFDQLGLLHSKTGNYFERFENEKNDIMNALASQNATFYGKKISLNDRKVLIRLVAAFLHEKLPKDLSLSIKEEGDYIELNIVEENANCSEKCKGGTVG